LLSIVGGVASFNASGTLITTIGVGRVEVWRTSDGAQQSSAPVYDNSYSEGWASLSGDGALVVLEHGLQDAAAVVNAVDGRLLQRIGNEYSLGIDNPVGNAFSSGHWIPSSREVVTQCGAFAIWSLPNETRSPAEINEIMKRTDPWKVEGDHLTQTFATVGGRVTRGGTPIAGGNVVATWGEVFITGTFRATTQADGSYVLPNLPRGIYHIVATDPASGAKTKVYPRYVTEPNQDGALDITF
jgi:hypothetical protein